MSLVISEINSTQPSSMVTMHNKYKIYQKKYTFEVELAQEDEGYESRIENFCIPTPLHRALRVYHVSIMDAFSFDPTIFGQSSTPLDHHAEPSPHRHRCCKVLRDPVNNAAHLPMLTPEVQPPGKQTFHHQYTVSHPPQTHC